MSNGSAKTCSQGCRVPDNSSPENIVKFLYRQFTEKSSWRLCPPVINQHKIIFQWNLKVRKGIETNEIELNGKIWDRMKWGEMEWNEMKWNGLG